MEMSSRRAANLIARGVSRSGRVIASRKRKGAGRSNAISKKVKRSNGLAERARQPDVQTASWFDWEKWPGYILLAYTIAWFALVSRFIAG
jgi:hypothetical protein